MTTHKTSNHETAPLSARTFQELGIDEKIAQVLADNGFEKPFPIQEAVIPLILSGNDVIGQAHTGTGKTAAYALPLLTKIVSRSNDANDNIVSKSLQVLIMVPTRELATQVRNEIVRFSKHLGIWTVSIYGGDSFARQTKLLRGGAQIVVATPGRLLDHMRRGSIKLDTVKYVVLDEADTMLDMGFIEEIEFILSKIGKIDSKDSRQTMLFSATMPQEILTLAKRHMHEDNTREIRLNKQEVGLDSIEQSYLIIDENQKLGRLVSILLSHKDIEESEKGQERQQQQQAIVFSATRLRADKLAANLKREGFKVSAIHGDLSQKERDRVMSRFRQGIENILVATDIAARGIDVSSVGHVINYDVPSEPETYFHRIGRTARAGADGKAISFVTPERLGEFERIQRLTKLPIKRLNEAMGIKIPSGQNRDRGNYKGQEGRSYRNNPYSGQRQQRRRNERSHHYGSRNRDHSSSKPNSNTSSGGNRG